MPSPRLAVNFDVALGLLHEAVNLAQPQTGTFAGFFGREKRFKCAIDCFSRHSSAVVGDRNKNVLARRNAGVLLAIPLVKVGVACFNRELAPFRHGVASIEREVEQRRFQLRSICFDFPKPGCADAFQLDILAKRPDQKIRKC